MKIAKTSASVMALLAATLLSPAAEKKLPKMIDLGAKKCIPCKMMAPILEDLKKEYAGQFITEFIDVWEAENAAKAEAYKINLIPTQIFFNAEGEELWRHEGFLSKEAILEKWKEFGVVLGDTTGIERWEPARIDERSKVEICYLCDGDIDPKTKVRVPTEKGDVNLCSPHHFFVMLSCLQQGVEGTEDSATVIDWKTGEATPVKTAIYLYGIEEQTGRPAIKAFSDRETALREQAGTGGSPVAYEALKRNELSHRCGFCDRSVYPQDASLVKVGPGLHTWGCCAHCALGVAARTGMDIEIHQPDGLTGEPIVIKTLNGSVASLAPETAVAWFGMRKDSEGNWGSAGCFHQGNFMNADRLKEWLDNHPLETGKQITIEEALASKMKMTDTQIQKACKIGECSPR